MSTMDQKPLDASEKKAGAKAGAKSATRAAKVTAEARPVKEANPARASLFEVYFGEGAARAQREPSAGRDRIRSDGDRRPTAEVEVVRRPSVRSSGADAVRQPSRRPGAADAERTAADTAQPRRTQARPAAGEGAQPESAPAPAERAHRGAGRAAAAVRPEESAAPAPQPMTRLDDGVAGHQEIVPASGSGSDVAPASAAVQAPDRAAPPEAAVLDSTAAAEPAVDAPGRPTAPATVEAPLPSVATEPEAAEAGATPDAGAVAPYAAQRPAAEISRPTAEFVRPPAEITRPVAEVTRVLRGPAASPRPLGPGAGPRLGVPNPAGATGARVGMPAPAGSRPTLGPPTPPGSGGSGTAAAGLVAGPRLSRPALRPPAVPGGEARPPVPPGNGRSVGAPRAFEQRPPRPAGPGGGARPAGPGGGRGARPGSGRGLVIPKVDPKVAEQPEQRKLTPGEQKKKPGATDFEVRRREAQKASEDKIFARRGPGRRASERRSLITKLVLDGPITVKELAHEMGVTASEVIKKLFLGFSMTATINSELDTDTAVLIGGEFGTEIEVKAPDLSVTLEAIDDPDEDPELKKPRPPVVVVMGHVDHGKTTLLDAIREARVAAGEAGGITQHIGAYMTEVRGKRITFLDTPGHEAFTAMRARGARVTDVAVLVVAADDGVMPQTVEAINHARAANVPIVVAVNKIDKPSANPDRVKQELAANGVVVEEWGGDVVSVPVSAKMGTNLEQLLEMILLVADVQDLKVNANKEARGTILEAQLDKARGPVSTVLVQAGTLQVGDTFVAGAAWGKARAMFDDRGRKVKKALPSTPVQVMGFNSVPEAGDVFRVVADEKIAREIGEKRASAKRQEDQQSAKVTNLEDLMAKVKEGEIRDLNIIIKGDVQGSVEAVRGAFEKLHNDEVQVRIIHSAVGAITESDVMLAAASKALVVGFNVRPDDRASRAAAQETVDIRTYRIIYEAVDDIKAALTGMLSPKFQEVVLGKAEVREVFKASKIGTVAGCYVLDGKVPKNAKVRLVRDGTVVWQGAIDSLRRFKDDAREVAAGFECGILLENFSDIKQGDIIEAYAMQEIRPSA